jgi:hypothetical protein
MVKIDGINLKSLVLYGSFRFYKVNQRIANACYFDSVSNRYKLDYVIENTLNNQKIEYSFIYNAALEYVAINKDIKKIKKWCLEQSLEL